jgi:hypothetical protein
MVDGHQFKNKGFVLVFWKWRLELQLIKNPPELFSKLSGSLLPSITVPRLAIWDNG